MADKLTINDEARQQEHHDMMRKVAPARDVDRDLVEAWVAALESGDFEQGNGFLRQKDRYCCLGVLGELMIRREPTRWSWWEAHLPMSGDDPLVDTDETVYALVDANHAGSFTIMGLPASLRQRVGLTDGFGGHPIGKRGRWRSDMGDYDQLASANDQGIEFGVVAQMLRETLLAQPAREMMDDEPPF